MKGCMHACLYITLYIIVILNACTHTHTHIYIMLKRSKEMNSTIINKSIIIIKKIRAITIIDKNTINK